MSRSFAVALACVLLLLSSSAWAGKKFALLVGVQKYRTGQPLPELSFAERDVNELAKVLEQGGFSVTLMTQSVGRVEVTEAYMPISDYIRDQVDAILSNPFLTADDVVLVAFAGHGVQYEAVASKPDSAKFYFCPADAEIAKLKTAADVTERNRLIDLGEVYAALNKCKAGAKLLLVDACRNDPSKPTAARSVASNTLPVLPPPPGGTAAFFSCSAHQQAFEDKDLRHGVFFHHVIEGLKGEADANTANRKADGKITLTELSEHVSGATYEFVLRKYKGAKQAPELKGEFRVSIPLLEVVSRSFMSVEEVKRRRELAVAIMREVETEWTEKTKLAGNSAAAAWCYAYLGDVVNCKRHYGAAEMNGKAAARILGLLKARNREATIADEISSLKKKNIGESEEIDVGLSMKDRIDFGLSADDLMQRVRIASESDSVIPCLIIVLRNPKQLIPLARRDELRLTLLSLEKKLKENYEAQSERLLIRALSDDIGAVRDGLKTFALKSFAEEMTFVPYWTVPLAVNGRVEELEELLAIYKRSEHHAPATVLAANALIDRQNKESARRIASELTGKEIYSCMSLTAGITYSDKVDEFTRLAGRLFDQPLRDRFKHRQTDKIAEKLVFVEGLLMDTPAAEPPR